MTLTRLFLLFVLVSTLIGCRSTCQNKRDDRDDRYGMTSRPKKTADNCDPIMTGYGQPIMNGSIVSSAPGATMPIMGTPDRGDGELPFPQTIPSPGVPSSPPVASIPGPAIGTYRGKN